MQSNTIFNKILVDSLSGQMHIILPPSTSIETAQKIIEKTHIALLQFVYTNCLIADNYMITYQAYLQKRKLYKFRLKQLTNALANDLRKTINIIRTDVNCDFYEEYSNVFYDHIRANVDRMQQRICKRCSNLGISADKVGLYANTSVLLNILYAAELTYHKIIKEILDNYGINLEHIYSFFCPNAAINSATVLVTEVMGSDLKYQNSICNDKTTCNLMVEIREQLTDKALHQQARKEAFENLPDDVKAIYEFRDGDIYKREKEACA